MQSAWSGRHIVMLNWRDLDHPQAGGAEVFAERIARQWVAAGAQVTLLAAQPGGLPPLTQREGVTIRRAGGTLGVYPAALLWVLRHRRHIDAVVDCQNGIPFFSPVVARRKTPVVQVIHHVHQRQFRLFFGPLASAIGRQLESRGARLVYRRRPSMAISPSTRTEVRAVLQLPGPRFLMPCGLDLPPAAALAERSPDPSIVCVGRLVPHKRLHLILAAIPEVLAFVPNLQVHLVGDGPDEARLHEISDRLGLPPGVLTWHGRLPSADRDRLMAQAWLTVNPTHGEGWGMGVMEAASLGVPALAFRVPGLRDSIRDGETGWLVPEGTSLATGVIKALQQLTDPAAAFAYRQSCRAWAACFSWQKSAELLAALLTSERRRLERGGKDRRRRDDTAAVLTSTAGTLPAGEPTFRGTDLMHCHDGGWGALLYGCDDAGAALALSRAETGGAPAALPPVAIRAADETDPLLATSDARTE